MPSSRGGDRLHARVPHEELAALRSWCSAHDKTLSSVVTGLIHRFNVKQQKHELADVDAPVDRVLTAAHEKVEDFHRQANSLKKQARGEAVPGVDFLD